ncbi:uncharacterized protein LOC134186100 [Corticium candelabrum]|uniref:uncharacterized protein LOC134186100 n=1 Tax=Corticium candelabrum TaxID=121492 RepID=UPI002E25D857|nr:uncharacterized protein LOC134186100 [Corticium candelabrum]
MMPSRTSERVFELSLELLEVYSISGAYKPKQVSKTLLRELLFADDCALVGHTYEDIQHIVNCLDRSTKRFGLSISLKKTEVLFQPRPGSNYNPPPVMIGDHPLSYVSNFKISKASAAFGKLYNRLW